MSGPPHILLTFSRDLWCELLHASLPLRLAAGRFDANRSLRSWARRAADALEPLVHVHGDWSIDLDAAGTELRCAQQELAGAASVTARLCATVDLARGRLELPVVLEPRLAAEIRLTAVRYEPALRAVVGELGHLRVHAGEGLAARAAARIAEEALIARIRRKSPVVLLRRERVEEMIGPVGGPLRVQLGVEDLDLDIRDDHVRLLIRFGFHTNGLCGDHDQS